MRKSLFLITDDIQISLQMCDLFYEVSNYFSEIWTEIAVVTSLSNVEGTSPPTLLKTESTTDI